MFCGGGVNGINGIGSGGNLWFGLLGTVMTLLFWGGIAALIFYGIKSFSAKPAMAKTPLEVLKERYAKGEISESDFERMKNHLQS